MGVCVSFFPKIVNYNVAGGQREGGMLVDVASAAMGAIMVGVKTISFSMYPTVETVPDVT